MADRINLNRNWDFTTQCNEKFITGESIAREYADLPHCMDNTSYDYISQVKSDKSCAYRKVIYFQPQWVDKRIYIEVGAAAHKSEVFINGELLYTHNCGYTSYTVELTGKLKDIGKNYLVIKVYGSESLDIPPFGGTLEAMTFCGLYREVYMHIKENAYISDVNVTYDIPDSEKLYGSSEQKEGLIYSKADVKSRIMIDAKGDTSALKVQQDLIALGYEEETRVYSTGDDIARLAEYREIRTSGKADYVELNMKLSHIRIWDVTYPALYEMVTRLYSGDKIIDEYRCKIGFRRTIFRGDGFYLNGRRVKIRGLLRHQSYPYAGYALPASIQRLDADILKKELALNAVRTAHYPQSYHFLDRCDELGLLVFTQIPGWRYLGGEDFKKQTVINLQDMIVEQRNHPSIVLWGTRIDDSADDDKLYAQTNDLAKALDPDRATCGVRCFNESHLLEDVFAYNDYSYMGRGIGCERKSDVLEDQTTPYIVSEYGGYNYIAKPFDNEKIRSLQALYHARILDGLISQETIAASFGRSMCDYNTYMEFGSGDNICYSGIMDMYRNPKMAAAVYSCFNDKRIVLELSSEFNLGDIEGGCFGKIYIFTNADSVRMYRNDEFIKEFNHEDCGYDNLPYAPILIDDYIGERLFDGEEFLQEQADYLKDALNGLAIFGSESLKRIDRKKGSRLFRKNGMTTEKIYELYGKYIGGWGDRCSRFRFDAIKDGKVVKSIIKEPACEKHLRVRIDHSHLKEGDTYDAVLLRFSMVDQNGNLLSYYNEPVQVTINGMLEQIGPRTPMIRGGLGGVILKTLGTTGVATVTLKATGAPAVRAKFVIE